MRGDKLRENSLFFPFFFFGGGVYFEQSGNQRVVTAPAPTVSPLGADCDSLWQWLSLSTLKLPLVCEHHNVICWAKCGRRRHVCPI